MKENDETDYRSKDIEKQTRRRWIVWIHKPTGRIVHRERKGKKP